jgi:hypothetical protein
MRMAVAAALGLAPIGVNVVGIKLLREGDNTRTEMWRQFKWARAKGICHLSSQSKNSVLIHSTASTLREAWSDNS